MMPRVLALAIAAALPLLAAAETAPKPPAPPPAPVTMTTAGAAAAAGAEAAAGASADATALANPTVIATASPTLVSSPAVSVTTPVSPILQSEVDVRPSQSLEVRQVRQAPSVATSPPMIVGCGAGGSAGGSGSGGSAILGFSWVPAECHGWTLAQSLIALGDFRGACEVLHAQATAARAREAGAKLTPCAELTPPPAPVVPPVSVIERDEQRNEVGPAYATREELREVADRITRQLASK
jgi:hypothetical protein